MAAQQSIHQAFLKPYSIQQSSYFQKRLSKKKERGDETVIAFFLFSRSLCFSPLKQQFRPFLIYEFQKYVGCGNSSSPIYIPAVLVYVSLFEFTLFCYYFGASVQLIKFLPSIMLGCGNRSSSILHSFSTRICFSVPNLPFSVTVLVSLSS